METDSTLRQRCRVCSNEGEDRFVGVRVEKGDVEVCFPVGYHLPEQEEALRADIIRLLHVLSACGKSEGRLDAEEAHSLVEQADFPVQACLTIIRDYLGRGRYYVEHDVSYRTDGRGRVCWPRTLRQQRPLVQEDGSLVFTRTTVRVSTPNADRDITHIHRFCVYEAFRKLGWLYVSFLPEKPGYEPERAAALDLLTRKLQHTNNDRDRLLFASMKAMLSRCDHAGEGSHFFLGTSSFEVVWEWMLDSAFGVADKRPYRPQTRWLLRGRDSGVEKHPLRPDVIMTDPRAGRFYVMDAKYYRYGRTGHPDNLPPGTDVNKQISYGEHLVKAMGLPEESVFNCFIMPYDKEENPFGLAGEVENIGEAIGSWRCVEGGCLSPYERIQGLVMDTRTLMHCYDARPARLRQQLAACMEQAVGASPAAPSGGRS